MGKFRIYGIPTEGVELLVDEQVFTAVRVDPYRRNDGGDSFLIIWRGRCAECGNPFEQATGTAGGIPRRRCQACRTPAIIRHVGPRGRKLKIEVRRPGASGVEA